MFTYTYSEATYQGARLRWLFILFPQNITVSSRVAVTSSPLNKQVIRPCATSFPFFFQCSRLIYYQGRRSPPFCWLKSRDFHVGDGRFWFSSKTLTKESFFYQNCQTETKYQNCFYLLTNISRQDPSNSHPNRQLLYLKIFVSLCGRIPSPKKNNKSMQVPMDLWILLPMAAVLEQAT